ncbi:MAG TPA: hypothetical protein VGM29_06820, partial [Polyangiaceae bacterium]
MNRIAWCRARFVIVAVGLTCSALPALAAPDPKLKKEAAALSTEGAAKFDANDFEGALALFQRAYDEYPVPTIGLYVARCQRALGRNAAALVTYNTVLANAGAGDARAEVKQALSDAKTERDEVAQRLAMVELTVTGATTFKVLADGVELKPIEGTRYAVEPGSRALEVQAAEGSASQTIQAVAGQSLSVTLAVQASAVQPVAAATAAAPAAVYAAPE